ncbi:hypothetical protein AJ78_00090 [Emergomyces pasteurianus Ep9510]|uniref:Uncharacterized protein n=1 Tax=Emergomyces pasteurianus Ep9510 TaxID=1447872 RepID=A0A1J9PU17_9EURO|nr:hypothetical protein AJ78_00090 [Emergomyces pasteurianus Ep9510]
MPLLFNIPKAGRLAHCIFVLNFLAFSTGLPSNACADEPSINQGSSGVPRCVTTNELITRDSQLQITSWEEDLKLSTKSKVVLGTGASLGLFLVILTVVGIKNEWYHTISSKLRADKQKSHPTIPEKYSSHFNKRPSSRERLLPWGSSTTSVLSFDSDHTLPYSSSYVSQTVDSCYLPIEIYQAQALKVPHHGIHAPPTAVFIRSIQCNRTPTSDRLAQVSVTSDPSRLTRAPPTPRLSNTLQTPKAQDSELNLAAPRTIILPEPIKSQP